MLTGHADQGRRLCSGPGRGGCACGRSARCWGCGARPGAPCHRGRRAARGRPRTLCGTCARGRSAARHGGPGARTPCTCRWWPPAAGMRAPPSTSSPNSTGPCAAPGPGGGWVSPGRAHPLSTRLGHRVVSVNARARTPYCPVRAAPGGAPEP